MGILNFFKTLEESAQIFDTRIQKSAECCHDLIEIRNEFHLLAQKNYKVLVNDENVTLIDEISAFFASYVFKQELSNRVWSAVEKIPPQSLDKLCIETIDIEIGNFSERQLNQRILKRIISSEAIIRRFAVVLIIDSIVKLDRLKRISEGIKYSEEDQLREQRKISGNPNTASSTIWYAIRELPIIRYFIGSYEIEVLRTSFSARQDLARKLKANTFFLPLTSTDKPIGEIKDRICWFKQDWKYSNSNYNRFLDLYSIIEMYYPKVFSLNPIAVNELVESIYLAPVNKKNCNPVIFHAEAWDFIENVDLRLAVNGLSRSSLSGND